MPSFTSRRTSATFSRVSPPIESTSSRLALQDACAERPDMTNLPAEVRRRLSRSGRSMWKTEQSADGGTTRKWLFRAEDGAAIETVLMGYRDGLRYASRARPVVPWLHILRHWTVRVRAAPPSGRDRRLRSPTRRPSSVRSGCRAFPIISRTSCSWGWVSRWPTTTGSERQCAG